MIAQDFPHTEQRQLRVRNTKVKWHASKVVANFENIVAVMC